MCEGFILHNITVKLREVFLFPKKIDFSIRIMFRCRKHNSCIWILILPMHHKIATVKSKECVTHRHEGCNGWNFA